MPSDAPSETHRSCDQSSEPAAFLGEAVRVKGHKLIITINIAYQLQLEVTYPNTLGQEDMLE